MMPDCENRPGHRGTQTPIDNWDPWHRAGGWRRDSEHRLMREAEFLLGPGPAGVVQAGRKMRVKRKGL